jgi:hypothetical protein
MTLTRVDFVARQLGVDAGSFGFYEWTGRTIKRHRAEIRTHHGFRDCTVADALNAGHGRSSRRPRTGWSASCQLNHHRPPPAGHEDQLLVPWCRRSY